MRFRGSTIHRCGAEVGKTREVVGLAAWKGQVYGRDQLIAAAQDGHVESIWEELIYQFESVSELAEGINWEQTLKKPYRKLTWRSGAVLHLRTAGTAGAPLRGLHVDDLYFDEAALILSRRICDEFWRAKKPRGGEVRIYSTPTGDRGTEFSRLCSVATPAADYIAEHPEAIDPLAQAMPGTRKRSRRCPQSWRPDGALPLAEDDHAHAVPVS